MDNKPKPKRVPQQQIMLSKLNVSDDADRKDDFNPSPRSPRDGSNVVQKARKKHSPPQ